MLYERERDIESEGYEDSEEGLVLQGEEEGEIELQGGLLMQSKILFHKENYRFLKAVDILVFRRVLL